MSRLCEPPKEVLAASPAVGYVGRPGATCGWSWVLSRLCPVSLPFQCWHLYHKWNSLAYDVKMSRFIICRPVKFWELLIHSQKYYCHCSETIFYISLLTLLTSDPPCRLDPKTMDTSFLNAVITEYICSEWSPNVKPYLRDDVFREKIQRAYIIARKAVSLYHARATVISGEIGKFGKIHQLSVSDWRKALLIREGGGRLYGSLYIWEYPLNIPVYHYSIQNVGPNMDVRLVLCTSSTQIVYSRYHVHINLCIYVCTAGKTNVIVDEHICIGSRFSRVGS